MKGKVLLTGVTGFLGSHTTIQLLERGYSVVGTLRDLKRADEIRATIARHTQNIQNLTFAQADLADNTNWRQLLQGVDFVQHIASPFPRTLPKDENELILPAKQGVLSILQAASDNGVKRVVLTSSSSAVLYGKEPGQKNGLFNESVWTDTSNKSDTTPYFRSKTIAEKEAWEFASQHKNIELVTVLPGAILGPVLEEDFGTSANIVIKMLDGSMPAIPNIGFDLVDVRSVADLLIRSMEMPEAAGQRILASTGFLPFKEIAAVLKEKYPARKIPAASMPNWLTHVLGWFDKSLRPVLLDLGTERRVDNSKAKKLLHWQPISNKEAILSCAESVIQLGLVK